jgi:hypothetical protein
VVEKIKAKTDIYLMMTVMKVNADITTITASLIRRPVILVMFVETFKTDVIVVISNVIICLMSCDPIIFSIMVSLLILKISLEEIKGKSFTNKYE